jgi:putative hemolysin
MVERGVKQSKVLLHLVDDRNRFLTSVLIGNTVVLLAADSLATYIFLQMGVPYGAVYSTVIMAVILLFFGEIIPKTVVVSDGERWALRLAGPMRLLAWVLTPFASTFLFTTELALRPFGIKHANQLFVTEDDIRTLVDVGAEQRVIEEEEREMIHSIIEFGDTIVREVMTPRPEVVAVSVDDSARRALELVITEGYSKLPVYQESKDDVVGAVYDRELMIALADGSIDKRPIRELMRSIVHVPEIKKIAELLREMQRDKFSMAIVVDEYGGTAGLVTMEDLLEEIVGEIRDEHDQDEQEPIRIINPNEAMVDAGTNIEDVNAKLGTRLPTDDFETIGGYIVGIFGKLPHEGEEINADRYTRLRVERTRGRRILTVHVYSNEAARGDDDEEHEAVEVSDGHA